MYKYLDEMYPNVFTKKTKFGKVNVGNDAIHYHSALRRNMMNMFCCDREEADVVIFRWRRTRPLLENIENSTNPDVFVNAKSDTNTTL
jgi:hypothetical protein